MHESAKPWECLIKSKHLVARIFLVFKNKLGKHSVSSLMYYIIIYIYTYIYTYSHFVKTDFRRCYLAWLLHSRTKIIKRIFMMKLSIKHSYAIVVCFAMQADVNNVIKKEIRASYKQTKNRIKQWFVIIWLVLHLYNMPLTDHKLFKPCKTTPVSSMYKQIICKYLILSILPLM